MIPNEIEEKKPHCFNFAFFVFPIDSYTFTRFRGDLFENWITYKLNNTVIANTRQFSTNQQQKKFSSLCSFSAIFCALWSERWINNRNSTNKKYFFPSSSSYSHAYTAHCANAHRHAHPMRMCECVKLSMSWTVMSRARWIYVKTHATSACVGHAVVVCVPECVYVKLDLGQLNFFVFCFFSPYIQIATSQMFIPNDVRRQKSKNQAQFRKCVSISSIQWNVAVTSLWVIHAKMEYFITFYDAQSIGSGLVAYILWLINIKWRNLKLRLRNSNGSTHQRHLLKRKSKRSSCLFLIESLRYTVIWLYTQCISV